VTRPQEQARSLARTIEAAGGRALVFPTIEIEDLADTRAILGTIDRLQEFDLAIFISPNAVRKAMNLVRARRGEAPWPQRLRVAAVGRGSRRELERLGLRDVIAPEAHADSESLLALPELGDVADKRVVVFRGEGGRELLGDTLVARGARVEYAECYRRAKPAADIRPLLEAWARGAVHAVTVSSSEGLANFYEMLGSLGQQWLRATPVFVPHARIAEDAGRRGLSEVIVAGPGDSELVEGLVAYFRGTK
jgi:uroporphyrinogen-III synthase